MKVPRLCVDCKNYIGIGCKKFYNLDIVTGEKSYYYARAVRENEKKCGEGAIYFEKNKYKIITLPYYFVKNNNLPFILIGGCYSYVVFLFYLFR